MNGLALHYFSIRLCCPSLQPVVRMQTQQSQLCIRGRQAGENSQQRRQRLSNNTDICFEYLSHLCAAYSSKSDRYEELFDAFTQFHEATVEALANEQYSEAQCVDFAVQWFRQFAATKDE